MREIPTPANFVRGKTYYWALDNFDTYRGDFYLRPAGGNVIIFTRVHPQEKHIFGKQFVDDIYELLGSKEEYYRSLNSIEPPAAGNTNALLRRIKKPDLEDNKEYLVVGGNQYFAVYNAATQLFTVKEILFMRIYDVNSLQFYEPDVREKIFAERIKEGTGIEDEAFLSEISGYLKGGRRKSRRNKRRKARKTCKRCRMRH